MAQAKSTTTHTTTTDAAKPEAGTSATPTPATAAEQTHTGPADTTATSDTTDYAALAQSAAVEHAKAKPTTESVKLNREVGGHDKGATISVTPGAADYLRGQGYLDEPDEG